MKLPAQGGCLCGAVRYEISAEPTWTGHCACSMCRRASGAPYITWFSLPASGFKFVKGAPADYISSKIAKRQFCAKCGSQMIFRFNEKPGQVDVTANSLDHPEAIVPRQLLFWDDRIDAHLKTDLPERKMSPSP